MEDQDVEQIGPPKGATLVKKDEPIAPPKGATLVTPKKDGGAGSPQQSPFSSPQSTQAFLDGQDASSAKLQSGAKQFQPTPQTDNMQKLANTVSQLKLTPQEPNEMAYTTRGTTVKSAVEDVKRQNDNKKFWINLNKTLMPANLSPQVKKIYDKMPDQEKTDFISSPQFSITRLNELQNLTPNDMKHWQYMNETATGKTLGFLGTNVARPIAKAGGQLIKGAEVIANHIARSNPLDPFTANDETIPTEKFNKRLDKATDVGLQPGDIKDVEGNNGIIGNTTSMVSSIVPLAVGGEALGITKAVFALQGLGHAKEELDDMEKSGETINPVAKDAYMGLSALANGYFMGEAGEGVLSKMPNSLRSKVMSGVVAETMKQTAGEELSADAMKDALLNNVKKWSINAKQGGLNFINHYVKTTGELTKFALANYGAKKTANVLNGKDTFETDLIGDVGNAALKQAPGLALLGAAGESQLAPHTEYKNEVVKSAMQDPSPENIEGIKQDLTNHGMQNGWHPEDIKATNDHVDKIAEIAKSLPKNIPVHKMNDAVDLVQGRNDLQKELATEQEQRKQLDPAVQDVISPQEQLLTDKVEQANDKLKALATGSKLTVSKGTGDEDGKFFKTIGGKKEEITESRYKLDALERDSKTDNNEQIKPNQEVPAEQPADETVGVPKTADQNDETTENSPIKSSQNEKGTQEHEETRPNEEKSSQSGESGKKGSESSQENDVTPTGGVETSPVTKTKEEQNDAINKEQQQKSGREEYKERDKGRKTPQTGDSNQPIGAAQSKGTETVKPRYSIKGDVITKLPLPEHSDLNTILKKEDGIDISHLKDVNQQERNTGGDQNSEARTNAKTVQQPENDGTRNDGENRPGESAERPKRSAGKTTFKKPPVKISESDEEPKEKGGSEVKKTILTKRAYEGEVSDDVKYYLEKKGLTRLSFTQKERWKQGTDFIDKFGDDAAFSAVEAGDIDGGLAVSVLAQLQIRNSRAVEALPEDSDERDELAKKHADLIALMEKRSYFSAEFIGQLAQAYQNSELNFASIKRQIEKITSKKLTKEQENKIKEVTAENDKLKAKLKDAESKLIEETDKAFKAGEEAAKNETKTEKAKRVANKLRDAAKIHRPGIFSSATPASLVWDTAVEITAKGIEAGGKVADAIDKGIEHIKDTDWYKSLPSSKKLSAEREFRSFNNDNSGSTDLADLQARFVDKADNKFTTAEARDIWGYMKENYINNGTSYQDALSKTANDLGLSWR